MRAKFNFGSNVEGFSEEEIGGEHGRELLGVESLQIFIDYARDRGVLSDVVAVVNVEYLNTDDEFLFFCGEVEGSEEDLEAFEKVNRTEVTRIK